MKRKALVTGGAGFIASHLAKRLLKENWSVCIIDNLSTGYMENVPKEAEFKLLDLTDDNFTDKLPTDIDVVFHFAGQSSGEISFEDPIYDLKTNCLSTVKLLDWCVNNNIKRFIYASSVSVYGNTLESTNENKEKNPTAFYGVGKLASEYYMNIYKSYGINSTAFRLFNVYGPGQNMKNLKQGMVSIYMAYVANNKPVLVKGTRDRFRDLIYIDDVIDIVIKSIDNEKTYDNIYNIGTGKKTHIYELIEKIIIGFGYNPEEYPVNYIEGTLGDIFGIYADIEKIKMDTGWIPKVSLETGISNMIHWINYDRNL